jgi:hypothetical protein
MASELALKPSVEKDLRSLPQSMANRSALAGCPYASWCSAPDSRRVRTQSGNRIAVRPSATYKTGIRSENNPVLRARAKEAGNTGRVDNPCNPDPGERRLNFNPTGGYGSGPGSRKKGGSESNGCTLNPGSYAELHKIPTSERGGMSQQSDIMKTLSPARKCRRDVLYGSKAPVGVLYGTR